MGIRADRKPWPLLAACRSSAKSGGDRCPHGHVHRSLTRTGFRTCEILTISPSSQMGERRGHTSAPYPLRRLSTKTSCPSNLGSKNEIPRPVRVREACGSFCAAGLPASPPRLAISSPVAYERAARATTRRCTHTKTGQLRSTASPIGGFYFPPIIRRCCGAPRER